MKDSFRNQLAQMHLQWFAEPTDPAPAGGEPQDGDPGDGNGKVLGGSPADPGDGKEPQDPVEFPVYRKSLPKELQDDDGLATAPKDFAGLYRRWKELEGANSENVIRIPGEDASEEDKAAYARSLAEAVGVPSTQDEYQLSVPELPHEVEYPEGFDTWFREKAFETGLSKAQAEELFSAFNERLSAQVEERFSDAEERNTALKTDLEKEFKNDYDALHAKAEQIATQLGGEEFVEFLVESGANMHPGLVAGLMRIAKRVGEDTLAHGSTSAPAPARRKGEISFPNSMKAIEEAQTRRA